MSDTELQLWIDHSKKSGWLAALLNLVIPGSGYMYCGRWILGLIAFLIVVLMYAVAIALSLLGMASWILWPITLMLVADGFLAARRYNRRLVEDALASRHRAPDLREPPNMQPESFTSVPGGEAGFSAPRKGPQADAWEGRSRRIWIGVASLAVVGVSSYLLLRLNVLERLESISPHKAAAARETAPSFDCGKASRRVERIICSSPELAQADRELADLYRQTLSVAGPDSTELRKSQRAFLSKRNRCMTPACVSEAYRVRGEEIAELRSATSTSAVSASSGSEERGSDSDKSASSDANGFDHIFEYTLFSQTLPDGKHPVWVYFQHGDKIARVDMPSLDMCMVTSSSDADWGVIRSRNYDIIPKGSEDWKFALNIWKTAFQRYMLVGEAKAC